IGGHEEVWSPPDTLGRQSQLTFLKQNHSMLEQSVGVARVTKATSGPEAMTMEQCLLRSNVSSGGGAMSPQEVRSSVSTGAAFCTRGKEQRSAHEVRSSILHRRKGAIPTQEMEHCLHRSSYTNK
ncbi:hypothetical protein Tco_1341599, partial [Tanacetum coccineum]